MALDPLFGKQLGGFILALVIDAEGDVAGLGEELPSSGGDSETAQETRLGLMKWISASPQVATELIHLEFEFFLAAAEDGDALHPVRRHQLGGGQIIGRRHRAAMVNLRKRQSAPFDSIRLSLGGSRSVGLSRKWNALPWRST